MIERPIKKAQEATEDIVDEGKVLCPWLPDPPRCPHDKSHMDADEQFVASQAMVCEVWVCNECGYRCFRDE